MNCNSTNCIYLITCNKCEKQYVGESGRKLKERINNHRSDIKTNKHTSIAIHFNDIGHNFKHFAILPIELITDPVRRKAKEKWWIKELQTKYPFGLNYYPL